MEVEGVIDGRRQMLSGTACRSGNGQWVFQDPPGRTVARTVIVERPVTRVIRTYPSTVLYTFNADRRHHWRDHSHRSHRSHRDQRW